MDLNRLRQETAPEHAQTEETVPLMSDTLTRAQYVEVLQRFYRVVAAWDRWADLHLPPDLAPLMQGRRRAALLAADLAALGGVVPKEEDLPSMDVSGFAPEDLRPVFLGRMYVMEGSTLGGQFIARHVQERLGLMGGEGNSYFTGYGDSTGLRWREFKAVLAQVPDAQEDAVIAGAKGFFHIFQQAMRHDVFPGGHTSPGEVAAGSTAVETGPISKPKEGIEPQ